MMQLILSKLIKTKIIIKKIIYIIINAAKPTHEEILILAKDETSIENFSKYTPYENGKIYAITKLILVLIGAIPRVIYRLIAR